MAQGGCQVVDQVLHSVGTVHGAVLKALVWRRDVVDIDSMERTSMACPALPLCGLAVTEAERSLPDMLPRLRSLLNRLGLEDLDALVVRMTGALVFWLGKLTHH